MPRWSLCVQSAQGCTISSGERRREKGGGGGGVEGGRRKERERIVHVNAPACLPCVYLTCFPPAVVCYAQTDRASAQWKRSVRYCGGESKAGRAAYSLLSYQGEEARSGSDRENARRREGGEADFGNNDDARKMTKTQ